MSPLPQRWWSNLTYLLQQTCHNPPLFDKADVFLWNCFLGLMYQTKYISIAFVRRRVFAQTLAEVHADHRALLQAKFPLLFYYQYWGWKATLAWQSKKKNGATIMMVIIINFGKLNLCTSYKWGPAPLFQHSGTDDSLVLIEGGKIDYLKEVNKVTGLIVDKCRRLDVWKFVVTSACPKIFQFSDWLQLTVRLKQSHVLERRQNRWLIIMWFAWR